MTREADRPTERRRAVPSPPRRLKSRHLLGIADLGADEIALILDTADAMKEIGGRADQEGADAARPHGRQPVLRAEHAHAHVVRDRREAPERRHAQHRHGDVERRRRARRWSTPPATSRRCRPDMIVMRHASSGAPHLLARICRSAHHQRRRRHARAPDAGAARRVHDPRAQGPARGPEGRDRRRPAAQPRAALERAAAEDDGRRGLGLRPADADAARPRAARRARRRRRSTRRSTAPTS